MFLDLLFPKRCIACKKYDEVVCMECLYAHLQMQNTHSVLTLGPYANPFWKTLIEQLKFHGIRELSIATGGLLAHLLQQTYTLPSSTWIVPIPLHKKRLRERGYNQSFLIAQVIGNNLHLPVVDILTRTKSTKPQSSQSPEKRFQNVQYAFECKRIGDLSPELIILIDDVYTTGATIAAAASALRLYYTGPIIVGAIARGS